MSTSDGSGSLTAASLGRMISNKFSYVEPKVKDDGTLEIIVPGPNIREIVAMIDETIPRVFPESIFGVDLSEDKYELIYIFWSHENRLLCQIRVQLEGEKPEVDSVCDMFAGMEWHERETHEMFGIHFKGHPDLRLLLLPDELEGKYPLRKRFQTDRSRLAESGLPQPKPRPTAGGDKQ